MLISIACRVTSSLDILPVLSFEKAAAPDALVYSVCDFMDVKVVLPAGSWSEGIYTSLRFNDSLLSENFMSWELILSLTMNSCFGISVNPSRLDQGRGIVQALLCDGEKNCSYDIVSPAVEISIYQNPFAVIYHDDSIFDTIFRPVQNEPAKGPVKSLLRLIDVMINASSKCELATPSAKNQTNKHPLCTRLGDFVPKRPNETTSTRHQIETEPVDTLILYAFAHSDGWREDNLLFWLIRGLVPDSRYHFVLIVNGHIEDSWRRLLDRLAASLACFEWHQRTDSGRDVCAWHSVLSGSIRLLRPLASFVRFVLANASCRGPFLPAYYRRPWPEVFLSALNHDVGLSGVTFHCDCQNAIVNGRREGACAIGLYAHVQSYLLAFGADLLPLVLDLQLQVCEGDGRKSAWWFELELTRRVLAGGKGLAVRQAVWAGVDFRDAAGVRRICATEAVPPGPDGNPVMAGQNAGVDLYPAEAVFFKTNTDAALSALRSYTRSAVMHLPWAAPFDSLCC
jgi:hypothetical protein